MIRNIIIFTCIGKSSYFNKSFWTKLSVSIPNNSIDYEID